MSGHRMPRRLLVGSPARELQRTIVQIYRTARQAYFKVETSGVFALALT